MFIHAPFMNDIEVSKRDDNENVTSIVIQYRFKINGIKKCLLLMGGDAEYQIWQHILKNNSDANNLKWDIFLAPHHCSWTFFNTSDEKNIIAKSAYEILKMKCGDSSCIISSSDEIKNDGTTLPCYKAKMAYERICGKDKF